MRDSSHATRDNPHWLKALQADSPQRDQAIAELREVLSRGLGASFRNRSDVDFDQIEDWVQDSIVRVLDKIESFRGESRFTTWAMRIAINVAYSDLRKARYRDVSLEKIRVPRTLLSPRAAQRREDQPSQRAMKRAIVKTMDRLMREELTETQRKVFYAVQIQQVPLSEVARRLEISRGTLYKRMHDARKRIKQAMEDAGYSYDECVRVFEND
jgi:RNA polymerase sigma-70 factor (ECF subfamily)